MSGAFTARRRSFRDPANAPPDLVCGDGAHQVGDKLRLFDVNVVAAVGGNMLKSPA